jgi:hypothetical protein
MVAPYRFRQKPPRESAIYASVPAARPVTSQALNSPEGKTNIYRIKFVVKGKAKRRNS